MKNHRSLTNKLILLASSVLAMLLMVACNTTSPPPAATPATEPRAAAAKEVYVIFEGPWAFAPDPKDANSIIALAPKTKRHRDLFVQWWDRPLASGVYELSVPPRGGPSTGMVDPNILRAKIDAQTVQRVLDTKLDRYAVRLPKPDAYVANLQYRSRAGATYPPDASTEKDYVSTVSLRYSVATLNGFSLTGSPDAGSMNPLLLQVDTPVINFVIAPGPGADPSDKCNTHSRGSFSDLAKLLNLTLFVDFPNDPPECHAKDPQHVRPAKAANMPPSRWERAVALFAGNVADIEVQGAGFVSPHIASAFFTSSIRGASGSLRRSFMAAALYFFGLHAADCRSPVIVADGN
jgi:hypothetical protein